MCLYNIGYDQNQCYKGTFNIDFRQNQCGKRIQHIENASNYTILSKISTSVSAITDVNNDFQH